jgi:eukaryotic-like serine/threonine-protein kinase
MRKPEPGCKPPLPAELIPLVETVCDRYKAALKTVEWPRIEAYLAEMPEPGRAALLWELLILERVYRGRSGEEPDATELEARFPGYGDVINGVFADTERAHTDSPPESSSTSVEDPARLAARNLLFGLLALHNNFIGRDALVAAFSVWLTDKTRPLGEILIERRAIDTARHALVSALVAEHLRQHGDDPTQSLAGLPPVDATARHDLEYLADSDLQASLSGCGPRPHESDVDSTVTASGETYSGSPDRFRILRFHARGGLGEVYVARDLELGREVALKRIRPDKERDDLRRKFVVEAQVTGGMEHPSIVPVYSLGADGGGHPFYAMRFLGDDNLSDVIRSYHADHPQPDPNALEFRKLMGRFVDVCEAIAYAHSKGVVHRDLKPNNVMLGKYGETLLIDWGLAKPTGQREPDRDGASEATLVPPAGIEQEPTIEGMQLGAPAYMSPEQASGKIKELNTRTDVYGLGAILYTLLTCQPPVPGRKGELPQSICARVARGEVAPPRSVNPRIPPALEAICRKALELDPADRYASARTLIDDVEHWLADEPVSVHPESRSDRLARWMRGHRAWVQASAASLILIALLTTATALLIARAYAHERKAREAERRAKQSAEAHFAVAREAANELYVTASKLLPTIPVTEDVRSNLAIETAREFDRFAELRPDDRVVLREAARAQRELGNVSRLFGRFERARDGFTRAVALLEGPVLSTPVDALTLSDLVLTRADQGDLLRAWGKTAEARATLQSALALSTKLRAMAPDRPEALRGEAYVLNVWTTLLVELGDEKGALESAGRALEIARRLDAQDKLLRDPTIAILAQFQAGTAQRELGHEPEAIRHLDDALARTLDLARRLPPDDPDARLLEASVRIEIGETTHAGTALASFERALVIMDKLVREHPKIPEHRVTLSLAQNGRGRALLEMEPRDFAKARQACEPARVVMKQLCDLMPATLPEQPAYRRTLGRVLANLAAIAHAQSDDAAARDLYRQAAAQHERVLALVPESKLDQRLLDSVRKELAALGQ